MPDEVVQRAKELLERATRERRAFAVRGGSDMSAAYETWLLDPKAMPPSQLFALVFDRHWGIALIYVNDATCCVAVFPSAKQSDIAVMCDAVHQDKTPVPPYMLNQGRQFVITGFNTKAPFMRHDVPSDSDGLPFPEVR